LKKDQKTEWKTYFHCYKTTHHYQSMYSDKVGTTKELLTTVNQILMMINIIYNI